jgi:hypothetical protein
VQSHDKCCDYILPSHLWKAAIWAMAAAVPMLHDSLIWVVFSPGYMFWWDPLDHVPLVCVNSQCVSGWPGPFSSTPLVVSKDE